MSPHDANIAVAGSKLDMKISVELGAVLGTLLGTSLGPRVDDAFLSGLGSSKQIGTVYRCLLEYNCSLRKDATVQGGTSYECNVSI